jgi:hypothetical protein
VPDDGNGIGRGIDAPNVEPRHFPNMKRQNFDVGEVMPSRLHLSRNKPELIEAFVGIFRRRPKFCCNEVVALFGQTWSISPRPIYEKLREVPFARRDIGQGNFPPARSGLLPTLESRSAADDRYFARIRRKMRDVRTAESKRLRQFVPSAAQLNRDAGI